MILCFQTMPLHSALTTPFNRYNSSKRLPLFELGTGVSSNRINLSTAAIFSGLFDVGLSSIEFGLQKTEPIAVAVVKLWPENEIVAAVEYFGLARIR
jgi:hypothetical protein